MIYTFFTLHYYSTYFITLFLSVQGKMTVQESTSDYAQGFCEVGILMSARH